MIVFRVLNDRLKDGVVDIVARLLSKVAGLVIDVCCLKFRENFRSAGLAFGVSHEFLASGSESSALGSDKLQYLCFRIENSDSVKYRSLDLDEVIEDWSGFKSFSGFSAPGCEPPFKCFFHSKYQS